MRLGEHSQIPDHVSNPEGTPDTYSSNKNNFGDLVVYVQQIKVSIEASFNIKQTSKWQLLSFHQNTQLQILNTTFNPRVLKCHKPPRVDALTPIASIPAYAPSQEVQFPQHIPTKLSAPPSLHAPSQEKGPNHSQTQQTQELLHVKPPTHYFYSLFVLRISNRTTAHPGNATATTNHSPPCPP